MGRYRLSDVEEDQRSKLLDDLSGVLVDPASARGDVFLSTHEVALLLRVSSATIRRWADTGKLDARWTLGGQRMFPLSAIQASLARLEPSRTRHVDLLQPQQHESSGGNLP